jgi:5'-nucleotidase/UDP-sugar diphosphatase
LARRATVIRDEREAHDHVLVLDAGSSVLGGWERDYDAKARLMIGAMNRMGYDALTIGEGELRMGSEDLLSVMPQADFPFLSANLTRGEGGPLLLEPYTLLSFDGHKVAVIGVTSPQATDIHQLDEGEVGVLDPVESVRQQVASVRNRADVIIVLSYLGLEMDQTLAQQVRGIDLIVGGLSGQNLIEPIQNETTGTVIVQTGKRGEWLGVVDLSLDRGGNVVRYEGRNRVLSEDVTEDAEFTAWLRSAQSTPTPSPKPSE